MSIKIQVIEALQAKFQDPERPFVIENANQTKLFIAEIYKETINENGYTRYPKITVLQSEKPENRCFQIDNQQNIDISHICIDGDFIIYGQTKYNLLSEKKTDERPDGLLIAENFLLFLELKLEQEEATFDKNNTKWDRFFEGITQIEDFVSFLRANGFEPKDFYGNQIEAVVCMRFEPKFESSAKRNNDRIKRAKKLGFEIKAHNCEEQFIV